MIGVFAIAGRPPSELARLGRRLAEGMATKPVWDVSLSMTDRVACGRVGPKDPQAVWASEDGLCQAWLDGFAYTLSPEGSNGDQPAGAGRLAQAVLTRGPEGLLDFQGEFLLLVLDERRRKLLAASDRFGVRTTYWHASSGHVMIGSELRLMIQLGLVPVKLDRLFLASLLRFNKCRLGDRTLFHGVSVVPPGVVLEYDLDQPREPQQRFYYRHEFVGDDRLEDGWADDVMAALQHAVPSVVGRDGESCSVALSGGLDSRMLLAAL